MSKKGRANGLSFAKGLICYLGYYQLGINRKELPRYFGISRPSVSKAIKRGEKFTKENNVKLLNQLPQNLPTGLINKRGDREDIQDEGAGGEQGGYKDRKVGGGKQEDKESGEQANFYFRGLTPFFHSVVIKGIEQRLRPIFKCPCCKSPMVILGFRRIAWGAG